MNYEERNAISGLISTLVVVALFGRLLRSGYLEGTFDGPGGITAWAQMVIWMIPVSMAICIGLIILVNILHGILSGSGETTILSDERDAAIGRRGMQVTLVLAALGFIASVGALAAGWSTLAGLNIILVGFTAGDLGGNISRMLAYRLGW